MQSLRAPAARGGGIGGKRAHHQQHPRPLPLASSSSSSTPCSARHQQQRSLAARAANGNGNGAAPAPAAAAVPTYPPAAETARTVMALAREGALATSSSGGGDDGPLSTPVAFGVTREGVAYVTLPAESPEARNLERDARCSVLLSPPSLPARRVAAVALRGTAAPAEAAAAADASSDASDADASAVRPQLPPAPQGARHYYLDVSSALYYGELDGTPPSGAVVQGADLLAAEPCLMREAAPALVDAWNGGRAEDVYRVAAAHLGVPLARMAYAELLWVDRLGVYVRAEVAPAEEGAGATSGDDEAAPAEMTLVRVPFQRPVLDERDARSALTMAAQIAWEGERSYVPPVPAVFSENAVAAALEAAAAAAN